MPPPPSKIYPQWGCSFCERSYSSPNLVTRHQDCYLTEYAEIYHPDGPTTFRASAHPLPVLRYVRHEADRHPGATHGDIVWGAVTFRPWSEPVPVMVRLDDVEAKRRHAEEFRYLTAEQWVARLGEIVPEEVKPDEEDEGEEQEDEDDEESEDEEEDSDKPEDGESDDPDDEDEEPDEEDDDDDDDNDDGLQANRAEEEPSPAPSVHPVTPQSRTSNRSRFSCLRSDRPIANSTVIGSHYEAVSGNVTDTATANVNSTPRARRGERARRTVPDDEDDDNDDDDGGPILHDISPLSKKGKQRANPVVEPASVSPSAVASGPSTKDKGKGHAKRVVEPSSPPSDATRPATAAPTPKPPAKRHHAATNTPQHPSSASRVSQFYTPGNTMPVFVRLSIVLGVYARPWIVPVAVRSSLEEAIAVVQEGLTQRGIGGDGLPRLVALAMGGVTLGERAWSRVVRRGGVVGVELVWNS